MSMVIDSLKGQLGTASDEYRELQGKLEKVQKKLDKTLERYTVVLRGPEFEEFKGERAGLDIQKARLAGQEKVLEEGMRRWWAIIDKCMSGVVSIAVTNANMSIIINILHN